MLKCLSLLLLGLLCIGLHVKAQLYPFVNYTLRDGLLGNKVKFIAQDSKGKLYFVTSNGLSVYDGARFTNYNIENGLLTNQINGVTEAGPDSMLIILNGPGLQYLHRGKIGTVQLKDSFCPVINQFIKCRNGNEYAFADEGMFLLSNGKFSKIPLDSQLNEGIVRNLFHATEIDSFLVINTDIVTTAFKAPKQLLVFNYLTGRVIAHRGDIEVYLTTRTPQNEVLLATTKGVFSLDKNALKEGKINLIIPSAYRVSPGILAYSFYFDQQKNCWITSDNGVMKIDPEGNCKLFSEQNGLPINRVSAVFQDRESIMWFGSDLAGVSKLTDQNLQLFKEFKPGFSVYDVYSSANTDSVLMYDQRHNTLLLLSGNKSQSWVGQDSKGFYSVAMGRHNMYAANASALYQLHVMPDGRFSSSPLFTTMGNGEAFSCLLTDRNENLIAVGQSITVVLPGHKIAREPLHYFADKAVLTKDDLLYIVTRSMHLYVYKIHPSGPGNYLELKSHYNLEKNNVEPRSLAVDDKGGIWIGTRNRGLYCFNVSGDSLQQVLQLTVKDGLTDNFIKSLGCDAAGNIWAGMPTGMDEITVHDNHISIENITKASNMYLDLNKIEPGKKGIVWAVASAGLLKVFPSDQPAPSITPEILLTKLTAGNQDLPLPVDGYNLNYNQNNLSFRVAVPSFFDEKKTFFTYKLEAESSGSGIWSEPSPRAEINFLNLPPGRYHLLVRAVFSNGKYRPLQAEYDFTIKAPWWETIWFRCIEILAAFLVMIFFLRLYHRNKLQQQKIVLEKKQAIEKERTRIAIDMHDDMGAGLSRIKVLSETIKFENQKGIVNPAHLQKISVYSEEMMDKMGEIVWALNQRNDSLNDLLSYTRSYAVDYLINHGIHCTFHAPPDAGEVFISGEVRRNIFLSVKEVLHNVFKHAAASIVDIRVTVGKELSVHIHDNGKGIDPANTREFANGLINIQKRMIEIGGTAEFKNDNGTCVILKLPMNA